MISEAFRCTFYCHFTDLVPSARFLEVTFPFRPRRSEILAGFEALWKATEKGPFPEIYKERIANGSFSRFKIVLFTPKR